ncbi:putative F-box protein At3g23970 [Durio zibethinus]|uniref:F-box protein At3g23970 n=1 Tax=Durio zibethinus TaxID=66656 RepID=A0A6P5YN18_DURZI|nr:putative F-box protein At3g23970 [Durio zibethinus]
MPKFNFDYQHQQGSEVLEEQTTSQPNKSSYNESPEDSIWAEILMKLPMKDAFKCKAVSKQWHSLISDPHFARCYLSRNPSCSISSPWALLKRNTAENSFQLDIVADHASSGDSNPPGFYVRSFFSRPPPVKDTFNVVGSRLELILCMATSTGQFFVCNPLNKQYKALPHPARTLLEHDHLEEVKVGFVVQTEGGLLVTGYTYKVVLLKREISNIFNLVTFSPETGEWYTSEADCPEETKLNELGCCVAWNRILHWLDEEAHNLVAIDPFRDTNKCRLIKPPESTDVISNKKIPADRLCQQSQGCLRYAIAGSFLENPFFKIWVLEDCNLGT